MLLPPSIRLSFALLVAFRTQRDGQGELYKLTKTTTVEEIQ